MQGALQAVIWVQLPQRMSAVHACERLRHCSCLNALQARPDPPAGQQQQSTLQKFPVPEQCSFAANLLDFPKYTLNAWACMCEVLSETFVGARAVCMGTSKPGQLYADSSLASLKCRGEPWYFQLLG